MILSTTLNELKKHRACTDGYAKLLRHVGLDYGHDKPIDLLTILESNGVDDCMWSLRAAVEPERDRISRHIAADCAESVLHLFTRVQHNDNRVASCIKTARDYADGLCDAAARNAAGAAAWNAARAAAGAAAWDAARDAAGAAAGAAAWAAAWAAARDAEREKQARIIISWLEVQK